MNEKGSYRTRDFFAAHINDKGRAFRIHIRLQNKKQMMNNLEENWGRDLSNSQKRKSQSPVNMKRYSTSLAIRDTQVKKPH